MARSMPERIRLIVNAAETISNGLASTGKKLVPGMGGLSV